MIELHIVPPEPDVFTKIAGQGEQTRAPYDTMRWITPEGTTREDIGGSAFASFWRITLPDSRTLLEVHIPNTGLSVLYDVDPDHLNDQEHIP